jgi:hypothetical protein
MRHGQMSVLAALMLAHGWGSRLPAQTPSEPRLYLTVLAGYRAGLPLWTLNRQPFAVLVAGPSTSTDSAVVAGPGLYDTLDLQREFSPSFVVGVSGTYFPSTHLGVQGEIAFLGMGIESGCAIRQTQPPYPGDLDPELCASLDRQKVATSAVSLSLGVVGRLTAGRGTYPYVRANAGVLARTRGTIEMIGLYANGDHFSTAIVVANPHTANTTVHLLLGAGVAVSMGSGYQLWLEGRDVIAPFERVTGPADPGGSTGVLVPPHGSRLLHNFVFVMGLDVVFEKQRRRRY